MMPGSPSFFRKVITVTRTVVVKGSRPVSLPYAGLLVGAETVVKDMGKLDPKAEKTLTLPDQEFSAKRGIGRLDEMRPSPA